jgi:hypothetical protein
MARAMSTVVLYEQRCMYSVMRRFGVPLPYGASIERNSGRLIGWIRTHTLGELM